MAYVPPLFPAEEIVPLDPELAHAAHQLGITTHSVDVARAEDMDGALAEMSAYGVQALLLTFGPAFWPRRRVIE